MTPDRLDQLAMCVGYVALFLGAFAFIIGASYGVRFAILYAKAFYFPGLNRVPEFLDSKDRFIVLDVQQIQARGAGLRLGLLLERMPENPFAAKPVVSVRELNGKFTPHQPSKEQL